MVAVLGGLLAMQWRLLRWAFHDTLHTAIVFSLCSLMLLSRAYWGGENVAYLQVLTARSHLGRHRGCLATDPA